MPWFTLCWLIVAAVVIGVATSRAALDRSVSARAAHGADSGGNLIDRIRAFFAMRDAAA